MASSLSSLEEDLKCVLCQNIYNNPLILLCTHSFCKSCLESSWSQRVAKECPVCRKRSSIEKPPVNQALKSACESFVKEKSNRVSGEERGLLCPQHLVKTQMFCLHDEQLVSAECITQEHNNHNFCSVSKAASEQRENLRGPLQELQGNHAFLSSEKLTCLSISQEIQSQLLHAQMQIKKEFDKIRQFLKDEEEARIAALKKEAERKSQKIKEKIDEIDQILSSVSKRIKQIEDYLNAEDSLFLKNLKDAEESAEYTVPDLELESGLLIDLAKHVGNLRHRVWEKMQDICPYFPVILEPNTANSGLHLSADLVKMVCRDMKQNLPNNPERFIVHPVTLGSEGFSSGTHSWVVDVGENPTWTIGVVKESVKRKEEITENELNGVWAIHLKDGSYSFNSQYRRIGRVQKIRVQVNYDNRQVMFHDSESNTQLQTYSHANEKLYPYFSTVGELPLKILSERVPFVLDRTYRQCQNCSHVSTHIGKGVQKCMISK